MALEYLDSPEKGNIWDTILPKISDQQNNISFNLNKDEVKVKAIKPVPGFCIKVKEEETDAKIFINVCCCPDIPKPANISEGELAGILQSDEPSSYRVPMSIGEAHEEKDKSGNTCTCYDVVINTEFFDIVKKSELFRSFIISLCYESIQDKYSLNLKSDSCIVLKNKAYYGTMPNHFIRDKPLIAELGNSNINMVQPMPNGLPCDDNSTKTKTPKFILRRKPAVGHPTHLILHVYLPNVTGELISVFVGERRVVMYERSCQYDLNIFLPYVIEQQDCIAEFDVCHKVLTVTMMALQNKDGCNGF